MSLPPQVDKTGKHRAAAMKESVHTGEVYYGMGPPALEPSHSEVTAGTSGVYNPEKGQSQSLGHYQQQAAPVKWMHQDAMQGSGWTQEAPVAGWGQNFSSYMGGANVRGQMAFHKGVHEGLPMGAENQMQTSVEVYRDNAQAQVQWDPMHQLQAYQQPAHVAPHTSQAPMLQPFQTFRPNKQQQQQQFNPGYYTGFPQNKAMQSLGYSEQPKTQQQPTPQQTPLLHQIQQQQQMHHHQQQIQHQHIHMQQHIQQQHLQQQHLQQQRQMQQQQYRQQLQERQMQQIQQMAQQTVPQEVTQAIQVPPKQPQNFVSYQSPEPCQQEVIKEETIEQQKHEIPKTVSGKAPEKVSPNPATETTSDTTPSAQPRRSRRLSREGQSPTTEGLAQAFKEPPSQNGVTAGQKAVESQTGATGGVIQSTRRRRRASKEINLETLAQQAAKRESLPAKDGKEDGPSGRQSSIMPLVIPVSVPVPQVQLHAQGGLSQGRPGPGEQGQTGQTEHKPSVIVARRRSLRNSVTDSLVQDGENDSGTDDDGKPKPKRRPRPEPLFIPPPKPSTFIAPSVYSSITSYQSNLRSPVRQMDNPLLMPPYTPPPILSPIRGGSGLYFSAFLSNMAAGNQIFPPTATTKTVSVSLLRLASSETTSPLPLLTEAAPVSLEPRINIGQRYQAEIPELQTLSSSQLDQHKADLVWIPIDQENVEDLMNMACSSVLNGGGTNQELVLHCLYECGGDFLETLGRLMLEDVVFQKGHPLSDYHYSGSDSWTPEEKCYFNKGISAYRKDFFMVQQLVQTKTVAQCVEFYYTYKKQVKVGRNGILTFGPPDSPGDKHNEAVVDVKSSQQNRLTHSDVAEDDKKEASSEQSQESSHQARVARSLQAHDYAATALVPKEPDNVKKEPPASRTRHEPAAKKGKAPPKPPPDPDEVFPCKKCGRVFYKVKSRSAHMKSHAEQEKKAAALRQKKEEEEQAASEAQARKAVLLAAAAAAAATAATSHRTAARNTEQAEVSSQDDSSEGGDDDDEDWH